MTQTNFVNFVRKLEGKEPTHETYLISAEKRLGSRLYTRYAGLLEFLCGERSLSDFDYWWISVSDTERQIAKAVRTLLGCNWWSDYYLKVGVYNKDGRAINFAVEQILRNCNSERQDDVPSNTSGQSAAFSTYYTCFFNGSWTNESNRAYDEWHTSSGHPQRQEVSTTTEDTRTREEPVRDRHTRYYAPRYLEQSLSRRVVRE